VEFLWAAGARVLYEVTAKRDRGAKCNERLSPRSGGHFICMHPLIFTTAISAALQPRVCPPPRGTMGSTPREREMLHRKPSRKNHLTGAESDGVSSRQKTISPLFSVSPSFSLDENRAADRTRFIRPNFQEPESVITARAATK
jgi:hypothetical protein